MGARTINASTVLLVSPHPDDGELGGGATIRVLIGLGFRVQCVVLTRGERSGEPVVREREGRAALACLGVPDENVYLGDFPDTGIPATHDTIAFLERFVCEELWAAFIPSVHDTHQDHRNTAYACWSAFRSVQRVLAYESPSVTAQFQPNTFVQINGHLKHKWRALNCHKTQVSQGKVYLQYRSIVHLAAFRGAQNGVDYAEAFEAIRLRIDPGTMLPGSRRGRGAALDGHTPRNVLPDLGPCATDS
jgi:LmbE family N-acetylglucosaminyl deacetylase